MKIRQGFVSNSSSSSFVCEACDEVIEAYDGEGNNECVSGHSLCDSCTKDGHGGYGISEIHCPICTKDVVPDYMILNWLLNVLGVKKEEIVKAIKSDSALEFFKEFVNKKEESKS